MKNKEKNASKIVEIACKGHDFGVDKNTNEVVDCRGTPCPTCLFFEDGQLLQGKKTMGRVRIHRKASDKQER